MSRRDDIKKFCDKNNIKMKINKKSKLYHISMEVRVTKKLTSASTDLDQAIDLISKSLSRLKLKGELQWQK